MATVEQIMSALEDVLYGAGMKQVDRQRVENFSGYEYPSAFINDIRREYVFSIGGLAQCRHFLLIVAFSRDESGTLHTTLNNLIDQVNGALMSAPTLNGLVERMRVERVDTDSGMLSPHCAAVFSVVLDYLTETEKPSGTIPFPGEITCSQLPVSSRERALCGLVSAVSSKSSFVEVKLIADRFTEDRLAALSSDELPCVIIFPFRESILTDIKPERALFGLDVGLRLVFSDASKKEQLIKDLKDAVGSDITLNGATNWARIESITEEARVGFLYQVQFVVRLGFTGKVAES